MRVRVCAGIAAAVMGMGLLAGCDSTTSGTPTTSTKPTISDAELFDPCTAIPDDALTAAGVNPASKKTEFFGVPQPGWKACSWSASWYFLSVFATSHTAAEAKANPDFTDFKPAQIPDRPDAFTYKEKAKSSGTDDRCYADFTASNGTLFEVVVATKGGEQSQEDVCAVAVRSAGALNNVLPK